MNTISFVDEAETRYSAHALIDWWDQARLSSSRVFVAGAGALGNEVLKNLALLGVGTIAVIDFDRVELSNLTRSVLYREADIGRWKAEVAAERIRELNPETCVLPIVGDLELDLGLGLLREFDLVIGCLDSVNARWRLNKACRRVGLPWINGGIGVDGGEVAFFAADHPCCYECGMTEEMWVRINERYSCTKLLKSVRDRKVPTTAIMASVVGAIQVQQAVAYLHNLPAHQRLVGPGEKLVIFLRPYHTFVVQLPSDAQCCAHERIGEVIKIAGSPQIWTAADVFRVLADKGCAPVSLKLPYELAIGLKCPKCGVDEVIIPLKRLSITQGRCPYCKEGRLPVCTSEITAGDQLATRRLCELGVPARAILEVTTSASQVFVELAG